LSTLYPLTKKEHSRRLCIPVLFFCLLTSLLLSASAKSFNKTHSYDQLKVKAAFILNLARFVEWPDEPEDKKTQDIVMCFYQYNFLDQSVNTIKNKKINEKPIKIKTINELTINERCEVVLIPAATLPTFLKYNDFKNLKNRITITDLTFSDSSLDMANIKSLENKVVFRLKRDDSRLRFEVNKKASEYLDILIGSELLKLGILVDDPENNTRKEGQ